MIMPCTIPIDSASRERSAEMGYLAWNTGMPAAGRALADVRVRDDRNAVRSLENAA
jgi:hypothetical protein